MRAEEIRVVATEFEVREFENRKVLVGYAARFNVLSEDLGGFRERIFPGAFRTSLSSQRELYALAHHDWRWPIGKRSNHSLKLFEDTHGLRGEIILPETSYANDLHWLVQNGYVSGMSFGFNIVDSTVVREGDEFVQELREVELFEVSPVTFPAYSQTTVSARSIERVNVCRVRHGVEKISHRVNPLMLC